VEGAQVSSDGSIGVTAHDGTLDDVCDKLDVAWTSTVGKRLQVTRTAPDGRSSIRSAQAVPVACHFNGADENQRPFTVTADLSKTYVSTTISLQTRTFQHDVVS
jgi:hypothetical protein